MKNRFLFSLFTVVFLNHTVNAEDVAEIKRGDFPYMAYIYYSDETVLDVTGNRFLRGAVLIRTDWLVTSAVQISSNNEEVRFPRKTLLARLGATSIDMNFSLNEDDDEQEKEIIQIVQPSNHSATQWWQADITLMKTLLPFKINSGVSPATIQSVDDLIAKSCTILVYAKMHENISEKRILIQLPVELLSSSIETCGNHFYNYTMICASDREDKNSAVYDPNFCQGNNGGPLVCEGKIMGLQTYIDNNCKPPHLYQLLSVWDKFILCGTEDKCAETQCTNTCVVTNKDPGTTSTTWSTFWEEVTTNKTDYIVDTPTLTTKTTEEEIFTATEEIFTTKEELVMTKQESFTIKEENVTTEEKNDLTAHTTTTELTTPQRPTRTVSLISEIISPISEDISHTQESKVLYRKKADENEEGINEEKIVINNVEDQLEDTGINKQQRPITRSDAGRNTRPVTETFFIACILASFI